jgi:hypothetical protein
MELIMDPTDDTVIAERNSSAVIEIPTNPNENNSNSWDESDTCKKVAMVFFAIPVGIYYAVEYVIKSIPVMADWTYNNILSPIYEKIKSIALAVFVDFPLWIYDNVLVHIAKGIKEAAVWTYNNLLCHVFEAVAKVAKAVFVDFPVWIYDNVLVHIAKGIKDVAVWTYDNLLGPAFEAVAKVAKAVFVDFPVWIYDNVLIHFA